ncbi:MAG TPA: alpha/beta hydrolase [Pseudobacteroides sp.]|uniref:alpha/beta fold hydrolase n=1 Tax=Pseudobacteroides sp. TaxID=1968840 RepID=UPI002F9373B8
MSKKKIALLPGWGMDSSVWNPILPLLNEYFEIIFCDWNGITNMEEYRLRVYELIEKEPGEIWIMGWSLGSLLAVDAAYKYQDRVESLILLSGTSRFTRDKRTGYLCGWPESVLEKMKAAMKNDVKKTMTSFCRSMFCSEEMEMDSYESFINSIDIYKPTCLPELETGLNFLKETDVRSLLEHISIPFLVIHGEKDTICPVDASRYIKDRVKGKTVLNIVKGAGHIPFYTHTAEFKRLINMFIVKGAT